MSYNVVIKFKDVEAVTTYEVGGHTFHPTRMLQLTYLTGDLEYFNMDTIVSVRIPKKSS